MRYRARAVIVIETIKFEVINLFENCHSVLSGTLQLTGSE